MLLPISSKTTILDFLPEVVSKIAEAVKDAENADLRVNWMDRVIVEIH